MKGGDVVIVEALRALADEGLLAGRQVIVVLTGDEENPGEPHATSRAALLEAAAASDIALAFEGSVPGMAVVGRRGIASWRLETAGSTGHSSRIFGPARGDGAIFEMARILSAFRAELPEPYLTFNPSVVVGGTAADLPEEGAAGTATGKHNVVPATTIVEGDLRFLSAEQRGRVEGKMRAIVGRSSPQTSAAISLSTVCRRWRRPPAIVRCSPLSIVPAATWVPAPTPSTTPTSAAPATSRSSPTSSPASTAWGRSASRNMPAASTSISPNCRASSSARRYSFIA